MLVLLVSNFLHFRSQFQFLLLRRQTIDDQSDKEVSDIKGCRKKSAKVYKSLHENSEADEKSFKLIRLIKISCATPHSRSVASPTRQSNTRTRTLLDSITTTMKALGDTKPREHSQNIAPQAHSACHGNDSYALLPYAHPVRVDVWRKQDFSDTATLTSIFMVKRRDPRPVEDVAVGQRTQKALRPVFTCQSGLASELDPLDKPVEDHSTFLLCRSPPYRHQLHPLVRVDYSRHTSFFNMIVFLDQPMPQESDTLSNDTLFTSRR